MIEIANANSEESESSSEDERETGPRVHTTDRPIHISDRLAQDKRYLSILCEKLTTRSDIAYDYVQKSEH